MREIKFQYLFKDEEYDKVRVLTMDIEELETHDYVPHNINRGWKLIARREYTELHDKNGKEIYEGDILGGIWRGCFIGWCDKCKALQLFFDTPEFPHLGYSNYFYASVDGHDTALHCNACNGDAHWCEVVEDDGKLEVIGNIWENPELIKEN